MVAATAAWRKMMFVSAMAKINGRDVIAAVWQREKKEEENEPEEKEKKKEKAATSAVYYLIAYSRSLSLSFFFYSHFIQIQRI